MTKGGRARVGATLVLLAASLSWPITVAAADPAATPTSTPAPTPRPLTCAERYPDPGPGGLDLRIPCIVRELMGLVEDPGDRPPRLTEWLPTIALLAAGGLIAAVILGRMVGAARARMGWRLAPAAPGLRWSCPRCHSANEPSRERCYSCGLAWTPEAMTMPVSEHPVMVQSFGIDAARRANEGFRREDAPPSEDDRPA